MKILQESDQNDFIHAKPFVLPDDLASAYLVLLAEHTAVVGERDVAVAEAANAQAMLSESDAQIAALELQIAKLRRELRGQRSERTARLLDQLELQLEELVMAASEHEVAAQVASAKASNVRSFTRERPVRKPWPENIERERIVIDPPTTCACCGGLRLSKLGGGHYRDAGRDPASLQGDRDRTREVLLPGLRGNQPAACAVPCHATRLYRC